MKLLGMNTPPNRYQLLEDSYTKHSTASQSLVRPKCLETLKLAEITRKPLKIRVPTLVRNAIVYMFHSVTVCMRKRHVRVVICGTRIVTERLYKVIHTKNNQAFDKWRIYVNTVIFGSLRE
jgi:hypothetical protein